MIKITFLATLLFLSLGCLGQDVVKNTRKGNQLFLDKKYSEAEILYRKALSIDSNDTRSQYNLGNTLYKEGDYEKSVEAYNKTLNHKELGKKQRADLLHNLGNSQMQLQDYEGAAQAYKEALKINPNDADTKYNLAYALKKIQQQKQDQNKDQQKQDKKDNKDDQQQQKPSSNPNEQPQDKPQDKKNQEQKGKSNKLDKKDAERMLKAVENQEKKTLDNVKKVKVEQRVKTDKDW